MGVRKFRSVEEMPGPAALPRLDPENLRIAFGLSFLAAKLARIRANPGVLKFRSWDDLVAYRDRRAMEDEREPTQSA